MRGEIDADPALQLRNLGVVCTEATVELAFQAVEIAAHCRVIGSQLGNRGIVIFLLHVVMTAGPGNRGPSHCEVSGNGTHYHLTLHAPGSVLGESPRERSEERRGGNKG